MRTDYLGNPVSVASDAAQAAADGTLGRHAQPGGHVHQRLQCRNQVRAVAAHLDAQCALPGRRIVYTNGSAPYAERVLAARGLSGLFDAVYGVEHAGFRPKPERAAFETIFAADNLDPTTGAMFEDDSRNLAAPHAMGMRTVHVTPMAEPADHIHHHTDDLTWFLAKLVG